MDSAFGPVDLPLSFDPSAPLAPPPVLTAAPDTDLTDGTRVRLELTGLRPGGWLYLYLCPGTSRSADCAFGDELLEPLVADDAGRIATEVMLRALNGAQSGARFDCRDVDCHLVATEGQTLNNNVAAPVAFDPDAPLAPEPTISVTPSSDLTDGQIVEVVVDRLFPGERFALLQCAPSFRYYAGCEEHGWVEQVAPEIGRYTTTIAVRDRFPAELGEGTVDCRTTTCVMGLWRLVDQDAILAVRAELAFAPLAAAPPATAAAIAPRFTG